jgi:signal transduction histidine kinase
MANKDQQPIPERDKTDNSLQAERQKTDDQLSKTLGAADLRAHEVIDRAREQADATLGKARAKAVDKLERAGASTETLATARAEQANEDLAVDTERKAADFLLVVERDQRRRTRASLLRVERAETDRHLLLERALADERLARIFGELAEAVRLRDDFIAVASHQLKTPLTPLALRLHSLAREAATQPESAFAHHVNDYVEMAKRQLTRLSTLMADLLDVSRIASGQLTLELEAVDFGALVRDVVARCKVQAEQAGSVIEVEAPSIIGQWDELLLEQAVTSLVENAIKFGRGRPIRLRLEAISGSARLTVRDEGIGIAPENQSRIFGRFERAVSERNYGGLGLGLYISRTVIEAMGGSISVESQPGRGSTFTLQLPLPGPGAVVFDGRVPRRG